jgi:phage major head subunit gpT-like protein
MIVDLNTRKAANTTLFQSLDKYLKAQLWKLACQVLPVSDATTYFEWLGDLPAVKEWKDQRQLEGIKKHNFSIVSKLWENTISMKYGDLKKNSQMIMSRVDSMAYNMAKHPSKLFFDLLTAGTTGLGFDGVAFFSASHPIDDKPGSVNSNLITGAGVDTLAHLTTDWAKARAGFLSLVDRAGDPIFDELGEVHVFHSPYYQDVFDQLFNNAANTSGIVNPYFKQAVTHPAPWLGVASTSTDWFALKLDMPLKPFIFAELEAINTNAPRAGWDESDVFKKNLIHFGAVGEYNIGYGFWQLAQMVNNS